MASPFVTVVSFHQFILCLWSKKNVQFFTPFLFTNQLFIVTKKNVIFEIETSFFASMSLNELNEKRYFNMFVKWIVFSDQFKIKSFTSSDYEKKSQKDNWKILNSGKFSVLEAIFGRLHIYWCKNICLFLNFTWWWKVNSTYL